MREGLHDHVEAWTTITSKCSVCRVEDPDHPGEEAEGGLEILCKADEKYP